MKKMLKQIRKLGPTFPGLIHLRIARKILRSSSWTTLSTAAKLLVLLLLMNSIRRKCRLPSPSSKDLTPTQEQVVNPTGYLAKWNSVAGFLQGIVDEMHRHASN